MASLTASDWTITVQRKYMYGGRRCTSGTLALAGTNTYPTGGVPMPDKSLFGMYRELVNFRLDGVAGGSTTNWVERWDKTNAKLQFYVSHDTAGATTLPL